MPLTDSDHIRNILARYVRNVDAGDHAAQAELFTSDAIIRLLAVNGGSEALIHEPVIGGRAFAAASAALRPPQLPDRKTRHCALDVLMDIKGAAAQLSAQFVVVVTARTESGKAHCEVTESGDYRLRCRRDADEWRISGLDICIDMFAN